MFLHSGTFLKTTHFVEVGVEVGGAELSGHLSKLLGM